MNESVLVTGAAGFIGSHLVADLVKQGRPVRCLVRKTSNRKWLDGLDVEMVEADLSDEAQVSKALENVGAVYHLAGAVAGTRQQLQHANVTCTRGLLQGCAKMPNPVRVVHVSSLAAAGPSTRHRPRRATDPCQPVSQYGHSKLAGEQVALEFADRLPITIVRPGAVFGPRDSEFARLFRLIRSLRCNVLLGLHDPPVGMVHVADLVKLLVEAEMQGTCLQSLAGPMHSYSVEDGVYFGSDPNPLSFRELGLRVRGMLQRPHAWTIPLPVTAVRPIALMSQVVAQVKQQRITFNLDKLREGAQDAWTCEVKREFAELNWRPRRSIDERFRETIQWYFDNHWL
ncbi:NAD-dependent epimerase/dehydratase family protein [Rosistilla oblonga]|uniref:NAD-dependent epimerase/dehydratase family protein n=1 Tax=Rosistilla oblonga TaxID=2527990 RepID=UPI003A975144